MSRFAEIQDRLVPDGESPFGPRFWRDSGGPGSEVLQFREPGLARPWGDLHVAAHDWIQNDYDHDLWRVLDVDPPVDVGEDYVIVARNPGVPLYRFVPGKTEKLLESERVAVLRSSLAGAVSLAKTPRGAFLAKLVASRVESAPPNLVLDDGADLFQVSDLAPTPEELRAWIALH